VVGRFTGLPLWTGWREKGAPSHEAICLFPLLMQMAFVSPGMAFGTTPCVPQGVVDCVYFVGAACCIVFFLALGMSISYVARSRHLKTVPALVRTTGSSITSYPSAASNFHSSACCSFFSVTLSMYLVSEEYPNSISRIFLGLPG
jgi:hypothetical protein